MSNSSVPRKAEKVKQDPAETRKQRALELYDSGYRAELNGIGLISVTNPDGQPYLVNLDFETCTCQAYYHALRRGNPTCKHIEGAELLLLRCERHPLTEEILSAVNQRGLIFTREIPEIHAHYDNGVHQGIVRIVSITYVGQEVCARVQRMDRPDVYQVRMSELTVDGIVHEHLERAAATIARFRAAGPISGTYRQGNTRQWTGGGYR